MNRTAAPLPGTLSEIWDILNAHVLGAGPQRPWAALATADAANRPRLRAVAMRSADRARAELELYTDLRSRKVGEIQGNPNVSILIWRPDIAVQIRVSGTAATASGAAVAGTWQTLTAEQRLNYSHQPPPGTPIGQPDGYEQTPSRDNFAVLTVSVAHIDYVSLAQTGHRRAEFAADDNWRGRWLSP